MSCNCKVYQRRVEKLKKKYGNLRKNHKKLLGVTVLLTEALEQFVKGELKPGVNDILLTCSSTYPDLFDNQKSSNCENDHPASLNNQTGVPADDECEKASDPATDLEREYYEGFMSRPRIPRSQ